MASYNIRLMDGTHFTDVADHVMFQMLAQLNVRDIASHETGEILYQSKAAKEEEVISNDKPIAKVDGVTRASIAVRGVKEYDEPIILPMAREWLVVTHADIPTCSFRTDDEQYATKRFERSVSSKWYDGPFYDEVRLYHNGRVIRAAVLGQEVIL